MISALGVTDDGTFDFGDCEHCFTWLHTSDPFLIPCIRVDGRRFCNAICANEDGYGWDEIEKAINDDV